MSINKFLVVLLLILLTFGIFVNASDSKIDSKVTAQLKHNSTAKIIAIKEATKTSVQLSALSSLPKNKVSHNFGDSFSAELNQDEINTLSNQGYTIVDDSPVKAFLQDTTQQINATQTWPLQINNINLTGISQTICLIDSGVDFSHQNLLGQNATCNIDCINKACIQNCSVTDDFGHGTHVAGIASAYGSLTGIAPGTKLIGVKSLDSTGSGSESDVIAGINWCTNNAETYNISVISMSLGITNSSGSEIPYSDYCDSVQDYASIAQAVNNAAAKNISIVIAAGNTLNTAGITSPACLKNATAVGAVNKSDTLFFNRNSLVRLVAPGVSINSTVPKGSCFLCSPSGYQVVSGTSMSTPHVAAAIAILKQILSATSQSKTPKQIENILFNTGKIISENNMNYSRINIYNATLSLDNIAPNVSLISPINNKINISLNQTFSCNATDWQLSNITFYLFNSTGLVYNETKNATGTSNTTSFNVSNLAFTIYNWTCKATDLNSNSFTASNDTLTIGGIQTTQLSPSDLTSTNLNQTNFTCESKSETGHELTNSTFYLWNSTKLIYNTTQTVKGFDNTTIFNFTFSQEDNYKWVCLSYNNNSNSSLTSNFTLTYDKTSPNITLISPDDAVSYTSNSQLVTFSYNFSDNFNFGNCSLIINNIINQTSQINSTNFNNTQQFLQPLLPSTYTWQINCSDLAGNQAFSPPRTLTINQPQTISSSSGGGGGGGSSGGGSSSQAYNTYFVNYQQLSEGQSRQVKKDDKIEFFIFDEKLDQHELSVNAVGPNYVNLTIKSNPINLTLGMGQSAKLNLTSPDYYNFYIKLENISQVNVILTIQSIHEQIPKPLPVIEENKTTTPTTAQNQESPKPKDYLIQVIIISLTVIVIVAFTVHLLDEKYFKRKRTNSHHPRIHHKK